MSATALQFSDLVQPGFVIDNLQADSRDDALTTMARFLVERGHCAESFPAAILDRERIHPSGLPMPGHKIAIPHTDSHHVTKSIILFARLADPVEFRSMGNPEETIAVQMISMFALKEKKLIGDMLETLITVYQHDEILDAILKAADAEHIFSILRKAVETFGK